MGGILAAIAAGGRPVEVPSVQDLQMRNMQLQAMAQAGMLRQQQMAESQQNMAINAIKMQEAQYGLQDQQIMRTRLPQMAQDPQYRTPEGEFDLRKAMHDLPINPLTFASWDKITAENEAKHAEARKNISAAVDAERTARQSAADALGSDMLRWQQETGSNPAVFSGLLMNHAQVYKDDAPMINSTLDQIHQNPALMTPWANQRIAGMSTAARQAYQEQQEKSAKATQERFAQGVQQVRAAAGPQGLSAEDSARLSKLYPELNLPAGAVGPDVIDRLTEAIVPAEKLPEYYQTKSGLRLPLEQVAFRNAANQVAAALHKTIDWSKPLTDQLAPDHIAMALKMAKEQTEPADVAAQRRVTTALAQANLSNVLTDKDYAVLGPMVANHDIAPSQFNELKTRQGFNPTKLIEAARKVDPNWSMAKAEAEFKTMEATEKAFAEGREAQLTRANSNAMEHLWMLNKARAALANSNLPGLNAIANWFGIQTGSDAATVFDHIAQRVGDEVSKAFIPGGGTGGERIQGASGYAHNLGDQQIASNIRADYALMDSQQRHLQEQYQKGTYGKGSQQLFDPRSIAMRDEILGGKPTQAGGGGGGARIRVQIPGHPPGEISADQKDAFLKKYPNAKVL